MAPTVVGRSIEVMLIPDAGDPSGVLATARLIDELGYDLVGIQDHPYHPGHLDSLSLMSVILGQTRQIRAFHSVANLALCPPAMLAKAAASLDLGCQASWNSAVLSTISSMEKRAMTDYDTQPEAVHAGLPADERSLARLFSYLIASAKGGIAGPLLAQFEGRHCSAGGNEPRAAVLGASDGLTSNLSLVMGVAGARQILLDLLAAGITFGLGKLIGSAVG